MASPSTQQSSSSSPRRLAELLDEQQEPFVLEIYLLERGYRIRRSLELESEISGCCSSTKHNNSKKFLKKSSSYHAGTNPASNYKPAQFSSIVRTFLTKFVSSKWRRRARTEKQVVEVTGGRCSFVSCSTAVSNNTWSDSETDGEFISLPSPLANDVSCDKTVPNKMMTTRWRFFEESKQCSPDSVLDEIDLLQAIPVYNNVRKPHENPPSETRIMFQKKVSEDAILSASLWELLMKLKTKKPKRKRGRKPFPDYINSKRALQKNRQLLFDCVREAVENGKQQKSTTGKGLMMGPEDIGKVICRNLKSWGKLSADVTNINKLLRTDLLGGAINDEWGGFEAWKREVVGEIGNGIVDEIIEDIISEISMINQY